MEYPVVCSPCPKPLKPRKRSTKPKFDQKKSNVRVLVSRIPFELDKSSVVRLETTIVEIFLSSFSLFQWRFEAEGEAEEAAGVAAAGFWSDQARRNPTSFSRFVFYKISV